MGYDRGEGVLHQPPHALIILALLLGKPIFNIFEHTFSIDHVFVWEHVHQTNAIGGIVEYFKNNLVYFVGVDTDYEVVDNYPSRSAPSDLAPAASAKPHDAFC